jgi:hypothetical protein
MRGNAALNANMTREITRGRRHRVPRILPWNLKTLKWLRFVSASGMTASEPIVSRYFCVILTRPNAVIFTGNNISSSAGVITGTATTGRQIQFALKLMNQDLKWLNL